MYSANHWGGSFEIQFEVEDENSPDLELDRSAVLLRQQLDETPQGWLLSPRESKKRDKYIDLGCIICQGKLFMWVAISILISFFVAGIPIVVVKRLPDDYCIGYMWVAISLPA